MARIYFVFLCFVFYSCTKEGPLSYYKKIATPTSDILYALHSDQNGHVTLVGGYVWSRGISLEAEADFSTFKIDTFSNKGLFDLLYTKDGTLLTVGTDGYLFEKRALQKNWIFHRLQNWDILHNIIETPSGYIASGGKSYEHGYIYLINKQFSIDTALYFGHEISEVVHIRDDKYISVGWGNVQITTDRGFHWNLLPIEGDFYASCVFTDSLRGWIVGYNGTLLHSKDGGDTWEDKSNVVSGNGFNSFRKIVSLRENELIIAGNSGKIWRSDDHGQSWQKYSLPTGSDIYDVSLKSDGHYLLAGSDGYFADIKF